ncbi:MAG: type II toxin-antitoxin system RelB/DinJ family antitoxin [Oscillospiraceae bacterium]|nr:type II toxin-antitoxin system RelB/DinJ family antitoxin [Oscillospiraceae bacterium]
MENTTVNLSIRVDKKLKQQAEALFAQLGMNLTTALNVFMRQSVREEQIPFKITAASEKPICMRALTESEMDEQIRLGLEDLEKNGGIPFSEVYSSLAKECGL